MGRYCAALVLSLALVCPGCESMSGTQRGAAVGTGTGAAVGAGVGALIGGDTTSTLIGAGAGAVVGGVAGAYLGHRYDQNKFNQTLNSAPSGQPTSWTNPETGNSFEVTPTRSYQRDGRQCRDFVQEVIIDGRRELINGTACRRPDGQQWDSIQE